MSTSSVSPLRTNAHTHTIFCDGEDTPRDMVKQALSLGFTSLGFSSHSYLPGEDWCLTPKTEPLYQQTLGQLKDEYKDQIRLYLGLELDAASVVDLTPYDYLIASVHEYPVSSGKLYSYDNTPELFLSLLNEVHGGDILSLCSAYYEQVYSHALATCRAFSGPVILGHFNLITKYNLQLKLINEDDPAYRRIASEALLESCRAGAIPEINTGAIARGRANDPYPAFWMLTLLHEQNYPVMINSDCHRKEDLDACFATAADYARAAGYRSILGLGATSTLEEIDL